MDLVSYIEFLVKSIAALPEMIRVEEIGRDENSIQIAVLIKESDMGAVIGRNGNTAKAIRTMAQTYSNLHDKKRDTTLFRSF